MLLLEKEVDRYLREECDEVRLERRSKKDSVDHITTSQVTKYSLVLDHGG